MDKFWNPYNFISLPEKKASAYEHKEDFHTGVIHYIITAKSPLFIPNSSTEQAFKESVQVKEHKSYDFFSYRQLENYDAKKGNPKPEKPVIPGSEMRGVIRSVYETLTDSCMGVLNSEELPIKRSPEPFKPGLIKKTNSGYQFYDAISYRIGVKGWQGNPPDNFRANRNGTLIYFNKPELCQSGNRKWRKCIGRYVIPEDSEVKNDFNDSGYLLKWGMGVKKQRYHVLTPAVINRRVQLSREDIETKLLQVIESYLSQPAVAEDNQAAYQEYERDLKEFLGSDDVDIYFPVTYSMVGAMVYLAPAVFTKEISNNSLEKLAGKFAPCAGDEECPACALFGHVDKSGTGSRGSKIRFSDLLIDADNPQNPKDAEDCYEPVVTLKTLGGPKLGNVEFYLQRPENATFWTYDYYYKNGEEYIEPAKLRGRKFYWHHPRTVLQKAEPTKLNKTIRPLKKDISFSGELYFEDISEKQLRQLIWILNSGTQELGYKLGAAKPLGLGSIVCQVTRVNERTIQIENGQFIYNIGEDIKEKYLGTYEDAEFSQTCKGEFYKIAGLHTVPKDIEITYPKTLKQKKTGDTGEGFRWFGDNHKTISGKGMPNSRKDRNYLLTLPLLGSDDMGLPYHISDFKVTVTEKNVSSKSKDRERKEINLNIGDEAAGCVKDVSDNGLFLRLDLENDAGVLEIHISNLRCKSKEEIERKFPKGEKVKAVCSGMRGGRMVYKVERIN